jgi:hypothetical protein
MDVALAVAGFIALDFLIWFALLTLIARLGGWQAVARRYSTTVEPEGQRFRWCFAAFRWLDYNGCLTMVVSPEGLYIAIFKLFRIGHPSLLIPWSALHFVKVHKVWIIHQVFLEVDAPALTTIKIPYRIFEAARPYLQGLPQDDLPAAAQ